MFYDTKVLGLVHTAKKISIINYKSIILRLCLKPLWEWVYPQKIDINNCKKLKDLVYSVTKIVGMSELVIDERTGVITVSDEQGGEVYDSFQIENDRLHLMREDKVTGEKTVIYFPFARFTKVTVYKAKV